MRKVIVPPKEEPSKAEQTWMAVINDVILRQYIVNFIDEHGYTRPDDVLQAIEADIFPSRKMGFTIRGTAESVHLTWPLDAYATAPYRLQCISTVMEALRQEGSIAVGPRPSTCGRQPSVHFVSCPIRRSEGRDGPCNYVKSVSPRVFCVCGREPK